MRSLIYRILSALVLVAVAASFAHAQDFVMIKKKAAAGAGGGGGISDDFSSDTSANYTAIAGGITVTGGAAHGSSAWASNMLRHNTSTGSNDNFAKADLGQNTNLDGASVCARVNTGASPNTAYCAYFIVGTSPAGKVYLGSYSGTTRTFITSYGDGTYTATGVYTTKISVIGNAIKVYVTDMNTPVIDTTDSTYSTGASVGFLIDRGNANTDITLDNFSGGTAP